MGRTMESKLTEGPVSRHLVSMTAPMVGALFATMAFNLADTYFVGQLGPTQLAAVSFTFPVVMLLISLAIGLSAGTSSVIARAIGERNQSRVRHLVTDSLMLSAGLSILIAIVGFFTIEPLFRLLGADDTLLPMISDYMEIWYLGLVFMIVPMVAGSALRATGDARTPSLIMGVGALGNIILDPIFIFGFGPIPRMELQGAALASVTVRVLTFFWPMYLLHFREHMLTFEKPTWFGLKKSWRDILHVGLPAAATNMIIPACTAVVYRLLASFGNDAVAAFGVASRVESMALIIFYSMSAIIGPFVGQNLGANKHDRIRESITVSFLFCLSYGTLLAVVLGFGGNWIAARFTDSGEVIKMVAAYLWLVPLSYGMHGVIMNANAAFNGMGRPLPATLISVLRMVVVYIPAAYLGSRFFGERGIFAATSVANVSVGIFAWVLIHRFVSQCRERRMAKTATLEAENASV